MPKLKTNGLELHYEVTGDPAAPPVVLIMGLGTQLTRWPEAFYRALTDAGYYVIRFDNRDIGLSTYFDQLGVPPIGGAIVRATLGMSVKAPYLLTDMAADTVGLLDALGIASAHVVGVSMGGMIGQILAARHGGRVRTLTSIMSSSGERNLPQPSLRLRAALARRPDPKAGRDVLIEHSARVLKMIASPRYPPDDKVLRQQIARDIERAYHPRGYVRQLLAILASGSRAPILGQITAPTLILHGSADPLVPPAAAPDLHRRIRGSRLEIFEGMGHDLPAALIPALTGAIIDHVGRAESAPRSRDSGTAVS